VFYITAPARFGGHFARSQKRPQPVLAIDMPVLKNDPSPFWQSLCPLYKTAGPFRQSLCPFSKTTRPVLAVVLVVLQNGPGKFRRSLCPFSKTTPARFGRRSGRSAKTAPAHFDRDFGSKTHPVLRQMLRFIMGIYFII
jgi:hypothetical protein